MPLNILLTGEDSRPDGALFKIKERALERPVTLDSAPTTSSNTMANNQIAFDGSNLFIKLADTVYRISLTQV